MKISPSRRFWPGGLVVGALLLGGAALLVNARRLSAGAPVYRLVVGQDLTYSVTYRNSARANFGALLPKEDGEAPSPTISNLTQAIQSDVAGKWKMTVVEKDDKGYVLACRLEDARVSLRSGEQENTEDAEVVRRELEKPLFARVSPQGKILDVRFDDSTQSLSQNFARALLGVSQFVVPSTANAPTKKWESVENDTAGQYTALYESAEEDDEKNAKNDTEANEGGSLFRKTKLSYSPVGKATATQAEMAQTVEPDTDIVARFDVRGGYLISLRGTEDQSVKMAGKNVAHSKSDVVFKLESQNSLEAKALETLQDANTQNEKLVKPVGLFVMPTTEEIEGASRKRTLGEDTIGTLLSELAKHQKAGETENSELYLKFRALADLHPESCPLMGKLLSVVPVTSLSFRILSESLASVDSPEAQNALLFAVQTRSKEEEALLRLIPFLGMEKNPSPESQKAVQELSESSPSPRIASTAQLALGSMARSLEKSAPKRLAQIVDVIVAQLNKAKTPAEIQQLLLTLGNTGSQRSLASLERYARSEVVPLRATALNSLRFVDSPTADSLLLSALSSDSQAEVRLEAALALSFRPMTDTSFQLQQAALQRDKNATVRLALLNNLHVSRKRLSEFKRIVEDLMLHDPSPDVRQAAERIKLQSPELFGPPKEIV